MGEVFKARDTRLDRTVALKVSKEQFTDRFEREARAAAALNHPNICTLHDVGPNYLVMEYIEGSPLKGPMPVEKAVVYAARILDARQGIKLLDFGLAKQSASPLEQSGATLTEALTRAGQVVGTLQYMSPEQLQGQEADSRSDLFAFGCVLYEMLSGQRAFPGDSAAATIGAIMHSEPKPLPAVGPPQKVTSRCLAKDPDERFQTARDLKTAILWAGEQVAPTPANSRANRSWRLAAALVPAAVFAWSYRPMGEYLAFNSAAPNRRRQIFLRRLDSFESKPLRGTGGVILMFWPGDSRSLAFSDGGPCAG